MTWTNAFDIGACTVVVNNDAGDEILRQVMAKGASQSVTDGDESVTVAVTSDGAVTLDRSIDNAGGYHLRVIPSYALGSQAIRLSGFSTDATASEIDCFADWDGWFNSGVSVALTEAIAGDWQPNPCDLSALPVHSELSAYGYKAAT